MADTPFQPCRSRWMATTAALVLGLGLALGAAPTRAAEPTPALADRLHAAAVSSFREARFSEAYGRFAGLADAGHAPSAAMALWMYQNSITLFGKDWDSNQEQLNAWAALARQPAPQMTARLYPHRVDNVAARERALAAR